jgi:hypothetical protein
MQRTRWLLIGLLLACAGCARRDWVSEGVVNGEVLTFSEGIKVELAVDGDEMWGMANDPLFSTLTCQRCYLRFRRVSSPVPASSDPPARQ